MKKVTKETHLQLLLIILLLLAVVFMMKSTFVKILTAPAPAPLPYVARPMTQEGKDFKANLVKTDKYYGDLEVYNDGNFNVRYDISKDNFAVTIKKEPYGSIKTTAEAWFIGKGFKDFDLCVLNVKFGRENGFSAKLAPKDTVFDRCPVPDTGSTSPEASDSTK